MADKQGLLCGVGLTEVQSYANLVLLQIAEHERDMRAQAQVRRDLLTLGPAGLGITFPQLSDTHGADSAPVVTGEYRDDNPDTAFDDGQGVVRYESGPEDMTEDQMTQLMAQLMADSAQGNMADPNGGWI